MKKIVLIFGTRPEAIKMAPLYHLLRADPGNFDVETWVTAQHRGMLDQVLDAFQITPDIDLDLMRDGQDLTDLTSGVLIRLREIFRANRPDLVLVHGDTTTALASAMASFYAGIPVGHVEAGLRTNNISNPFPEEFNRQLIARIAAWHFAPTEKAKFNLLAEGVPPHQITVTGNTVIDSLLWITKKQNGSPSGLLAEKQLDDFLNFNWKSEKYILITSHRRENFGAGLENICEAVNRLAAGFPGIHFVYPVHLNPAVSGPVKKQLGAVANVHLLEPLEYEEFSMLLSNAYFVMTDSGGIQEEAPCLGKPVLVMRDTTERPEALDAGTAVLVGTETERIVQGATNLLVDDELYNSMSTAHNPFGDGLACQRIVTAIARS